jgi:hypothetical protein
MIEEKQPCNFKKDQPSVENIFISLQYEGFFRIVTQPLKSKNQFIVIPSRIGVRDDDWGTFTRPSVL